jgi:hypothetical protein
MEERRLPRSQLPELHSAPLAASAVLVEHKHPRVVEFAVLLGLDAEVLPSAEDRDPRTTTASTKRGTEPRSAIDRQEPERVTPYERADGAEVSLVECGDLDRV